MAKTLGAQIRTLRTQFHRPYKWQKFDQFISFHSKSIWYLFLLYLFDIVTDTKFIQQNTCFKSHIYYVGSTFVEVSGKVWIQ